MAEGRGIPVICGITKAATWDTAVSVNATADSNTLRFRPLTWEVNEEVTELPDESFNRATVRRDRAKTGRYLISGTFSLEIKYEGLDFLLALAMGSTYDFSNVATVYYRGKYQPIDVDSGATVDNDLGVFGTLAWYDGIVTHEVASMKIVRWKFSASAGNVVIGEFDWIGNRRREDTAANPSGLTSATEHTRINCVQSLNSVLSYQTIAQGGTLANVEIIMWEVEGTKEHDTGDIAYSSTYSPYPREFRLGRTTITGQVQFPYSSTARLDDWLAGTLYELKLHHVVTAGEEEWGIWLPSVKYTGGTFHPTSMGQIPHTVNFVSERAEGTAPSWTAPVVAHIEAVNQLATDPLA